MSIEDSQSHYDPPSTEAFFNSLHEPSIAEKKPYYIVTKGTHRVYPKYFPKIQTMATLGDAPASETIILYDQIRRNGKRDDDNKFPEKKEKAIVNIGEKSKINKKYYHVNTPGSPFFMYSQTKPTKLSKILFPGMKSVKYVLDNFDSSLSPDNNIGFCFMFLLPFNGEKLMVTQFYNFKERPGPGPGDFQQAMLNLITNFNIKSGIPVANIACCALNFHNNVYAAYHVSSEYNEVIWKKIKIFISDIKEGNSTVKTEEHRISTVISSDAIIDADVHLIDYYSYSDSKSELYPSGLRHGSFLELFEFLLTNPDPDAIFGGTRKKKRKTKRKKQRSKRRSQKNSNRSLKNRQ